MSVLVEIIAKKPVGLSANCPFCANQNHFGYQNNSVMRAPFTLIRSDHKANLDITICYNDVYKPQQPIFPNPSQVKNREYTWKIQTNIHEGFEVKNSNETKPIKMIWWEGTRQISVVDQEQLLTCVPSSQVCFFLKRVLKIQGVYEKESEAFATYWQQCIANEYPLSDHVRIKWVNPKNHHHYIPHLKVSGKDKDNFKKNRNYFLFEPTRERKLQTLDQEDFLRMMDSKPFLSNVVIDLGGEFLDTNESRKYRKILLEDIKHAFNQNFINRYIRT